MGLDLFYFKRLDVAPIWFPHTAGFTHKHQIGAT